MSGNNGNAEVISDAAVRNSDDRLAVELLTFLRKKLTEAIGPVAPFVLSDHIRALDESADSFPAAKLHELVQRLRKEILTDTLRQRFEEEMAVEIAKVRDERAS